MSPIRVVVDKVRDELGAGVHIKQVRVGQHCRLEDKYKDKFEQYKDQFGKYKDKFDKYKDKFDKYKDKSDKNKDKLEKS